MTHCFLIGNAECTPHSSTDCKGELTCDHSFIDESDIVDDLLKGRTWNFGCSFRPEKICKYQDGEEVVMGGGCRFRETEGPIEKRLLL